MLAFQLLLAHPDLSSHNIHSIGTYWFALLAAQPRQPDRLHISKLSECSWCLCTSVHTPSI